MCSAIAWLFGFLVFAQKIPDRVQKPKKKTDAIVVLTGGSLRLEAGLELLAQKYAKKLFVSGSHCKLSHAAQLSRISVGYARY